MKHPFSPTVLLIILFIASQVLGLGFIAADTSSAVDEQGNIVVENSEPITGPRPATTGLGTFLYLAIGIGIGTGLLLIMAKFRARGLWKIWYMFAIAVTSATALGTVLNAWVAFGIGIIAAILKVYKPQLLIHNLTEILIHSGIALILVPILDLFWASMMLIAIAAYDAYAVWKSKHMVTLATFMTDSRLFAGLQIPYKKISGKITSKPQKNSKTVKVKSAILGGGDIAFPLLFSGTVYQWLIANSIQYAYGYTLIITASATIGLTLLFTQARKDQFYPAMPFLSAACFVGFGIVWLIV